VKKLCASLLVVLLIGLCACGRAEMVKDSEMGDESNGYSDMVREWKCPRGAYADYIDDIYYTENGRAGSSGQEASSAIALLDLSNVLSGEGVESLIPVFATMNDAQARVFAAQWIKLRPLADEAIRDPKEFQKGHTDGALEDFDATLYSVDKLEDLDRMVAMALLPAGMR